LQFKSCQASGEPTPGVLSQQMLRVIVSGVAERLDEQREPVNTF
jgi:hypothetical protein